MCKRLTAGDFFKRDKEKRNKMQIGDRIKIRKDCLEGVDRCRDKCLLASLAFSHATKMMQTAHEEMWEFIKETHPETKGWNLSIVEGRTEIQITSKGE